MGEISKALPSPFGNQKSMAMPRGTETARNRETGFAPPRPRLEHAGGMASRKGRASVAPTPRSTVLRGNDFVVRKVIATLSVSSVSVRHVPRGPHQKRRTLDDSPNERRPPVV